MNHFYELDDNDIKNIIAEKFNCIPENVHVLGGSYETIKVNVRFETEM